ncbi:MAG: nucleotidyltransferase domain-containing protein [Candidatus Woesearchaeota archaeon]|nr:nucleotidyltransferase domain-containing protein [Candidatus Woesearchaeota archaeon]
MQAELTRTITVESLYLFGSRARGTFHASSDFDIAIVSSSFEHLTFLKRQLLVRPLLRKVLKNAFLDVICYTPEEFNAGKKGFLPELIEREGIEA